MNAYDYISLQYGYKMWAKFVLLVCFFVVTYGFKATIHDTDLLSGELGLSTQIFEGDWDWFRYTGRFQLVNNFLNRAFRWRCHCIWLLLLEWMVCYVQFDLFIIFLLLV